MKCKNCKELTNNNFCDNCGQSTETTRLGLRYIFKHIAFYSFLRFDKKLLRTLVAIIKLPGVVAHEYIDGKRIKYYNFFSTLLILLGIILLNTALTPDSSFESASPTVDSFDRTYLFIDNNSRLLLFGLIPLLSFISWGLFYRLKKKHSRAPYFRRGNTNRNYNNYCYNDLH